MIVDCHVNVYDDRQMLPLFLERRASPGPAGSRRGRTQTRSLRRCKASTGDRLLAALRGLHRHRRRRRGDGPGGGGSSRETDRLCRVDPRMPDCMDLLVHGHRGTELKGVKFGPIYNGVSLLDPRLEPVYAYLRAAQSAADDAHGHDLRRSNAPVELGRPLDVDTVARRLSRPEDDHGPYGPPLVRGMHRRRPQEPERLLRGVGALLSRPGNSATS